MDKFKAKKEGRRADRGRFEKQLEEEMQKITDKFVKEIDKACEAKNKEIMEI